MVTRSQVPQRFLSQEEKKRISTAIRRAESLTSGEIRVALDYKAGRDILSHAGNVFKKLGMTRTRLRNGILIFLAVRDRAFVVLGDAGIHEKVKAGFWQSVTAVMQPYFEKDDFATGLEAGIGKVGEALAIYYPVNPEDRNELPDAILEQGAPSPDSE